MSRLGVPDRPRTVALTPATTGRRHGGRERIDP